MVGREISTGLQRYNCFCFYVYINSRLGCGEARRERLSPDEHECGAGKGYWKVESLNTGMRITQGRNEEHNREKTSDPRE